MIKSNETPSSTRRIQDLSESRELSLFEILGAVISNLAIPSGRLKVRLDLPGRHLTNWQRRS